MRLKPDWRPIETYEATSALVLFKHESGRFSLSVYDRRLSKKKYTWRHSVDAPTHWAPFELEVE